MLAPRSTRDALTLDLAGQVAGSAGVSACSTPRGSSVDEWVEAGEPTMWEKAHDRVRWKSPGLTDTDSEATVVVSGRKSRCHVHIHLSSVYARLSWPG